jgi:hypothetical protein
MKDLERHISDIRDELDSDQPRVGHDTRFLQKLDRGPRQMNFRQILQIAASVAILVTSGLVLVKLNKSGDKMVAEEIPASVVEADFYYTSQVNARYDKIQSFSFENAEEKAVLLDELDDLDGFYQQLMNDLKANPEDDRVINALIRHYQIKLEVMDQIIIQLNQIKSETNQNHGTESI